MISISSRFKKSLSPIVLSYRHGAACARATLNGLF
jgi:hypothetical protein